MRNLLKRPVFEKCDSNWIDVLPTVTKQYNNRTHSSTKLTLIQVSLMKNEGCVYIKLLDKRKKINPKFQVNDLVGRADLKKTFSKGDTTKWFYKKYKITEIFNSIISSYRLHNLPARYNEALLTKTNLTLKENKADMKASNLI